MSLYLGTNLISGAQDISGKANTSLDNLNATGRGIINGKASTSLNNLTSTGKNIGNWSSNVTNCITEIPQRINVEFNSGTLTLVSGSKLYVPAGFQQDGVTPKFNTVTINSYIDYSNASSDTKTRLLFYRNGSLEAYEYSQSGSSGPSGSGWIMYYDIAENLVKLYSDGDEMYSGYSLPIAQVTADGSHIVGKIDQVFNGFGYIGSTVFALPGVKGLIPDGRNADGTLKNTECSISSVQTVTITSSWGTGREQFFINGINLGVHRACTAYYISDTKPNTTILTSYWYSPKENILRSSYDTGTTWTKTSGAESFVISFSSGKVDSISSKTAFRALDYNDKGTIAGWSMPSNKYIDLTLGASGTEYTAPANGYINISRTSSASGQYISGYTGINSSVYSTASGQTLRLSMPVRKGASFQINYSAATAGFFRFVYAKGEQ